MLTNIKYRSSNQPISVAWTNEILWMLLHMLELFIYETPYSYRLIVLVNVTGGLNEQNLKITCMGL